MRALALALAISISGSVTGCAFAVKHPAITAGIVGGTVAFGSCELGTDFESHGTCGIIGGSGALGLAGIVALAILLGGEGHTVLVGDEGPPPIVREKKSPAPEPASTPLPEPTSPAPPPPAP
jgi:hypothetical protein